MSAPAPRMRIWYFSDLHMEFAKHERPPTDFGVPDADVCVIAGDVTRPLAQSVEWAARHVLPYMPVVMAAGNHEFYSGSIREGWEDGLARAALYEDLHLLENESVVIGGVRFLGTTLWTDYDFYEDPKVAMKFARIGINDHRLILRTLQPASQFLPEDAAEIHAAARSWLEGELAAGFDGPTVVMTHHCPHENSVHMKFLGSPYNPAFVSDLSPVIEAYQPELWIHGHTHCSFDYDVGRTRVVCNPAGYLDENPMFEPHKIVEIEAPGFVRDPARRERPVEAGGKAMDDNIEAIRAAVLASRPYHLRGKRKD